LALAHDCYRRGILAHAHLYESYLAAHASHRYPESPKFVSVLRSLFFLLPDLDLPFRWLAAHGRLREAERSVARAHGVKQEDQAESQIVQSIVRQIAKQVEAESHLQASDWISCFKFENKTLYRTLLAMTLQSLQQLTGANYFFYYGATYFPECGP
jgi:hypothetical protein